MAMMNCQVAMTTYFFLVPFLGGLPFLVPYVPGPYGAMIKN
tara:strand:- start:1021 stop:1143 length:123 start_codon:yes stop_codon:yes gene_type:complete